MKQIIILIVVAFMGGLTACSLDLDIDSLAKNLGETTTPSTDPEDDGSGGGGAPFVPGGVDVEWGSMPTIGSTYISFSVIYNSSVNASTITIAVSDLVIGTTGTLASCVVAMPWGAGTYTYVTITGCTGSGDISISLKPNTAKNLAGDFIDGIAATTFPVDTSRPTAPTGVTLGANTSLSVSPTITYTAGTDIGSGIAKHQVRLSLDESPWSTIKDWTDHVSGDALSGLSLVSDKKYSIEVKAVDLAGNYSFSSTAVKFRGYIVTIDCSVGTPAIGSYCHGGAVYAGTFDGGTYMVTPSGCTDSATPTCDGGTDLTKPWDDGVMFNPQIAGVERVSLATTPSSTSYRGYVNTPLIAAKYPSTSTAAKYCYDMTFGGYSDWYLPSKTEMSYIYCRSINKLGMHSTSYPNEDPNCAGVGGRQEILKGFEDRYYWTSTEALSIDAYAWGQSFITGANLANVKSTSLNVRCVRRY